MWTQQHNRECYKISNWSQNVFIFSSFLTISHSQKSCYEVSCIQKQNHQNLKFFLFLFFSSFILFLILRVLKFSHSSDKKQPTLTAIVVANSLTWYNFMVTTSIKTRTEFPLLSFTSDRAEHAQLWIDSKQLSNGYTWWLAETIFQLILTDMPRER